MKKARIKIPLEEICNSISLGMAIIDPESRSIIYSNKYLQNLMDKGLRIKFPNILENAIRKNLKISTVQVNLDTYGYTFEPYDRYWVFVIKNISESLFHIGIMRERTSVDSLNQLFSILRHEIGNPLNTMKLSLGVLKEQFREFPPSKIEEYIERILSQTEAIEKVLSTMRNFVTLGSLSLKKINLGEFIPRTVIFSEELRKTSNIKIFLDEIPDVAVKADPVALRQVLVNLLKNSVEAMEKNKGDKIIEIRVHTAGDFARISIYDSGPGIPPEVINKIFVPFYTTKKTGTGMGLPLSKRLITSMGGYLEIVNATGGALAMVYLPLWKEPKEEN